MWPFPGAAAPIGRIVSGFPTLDFAVRVIFPAASISATLAGASGSETTRGVPESPPSRRGRISGTSSVSFKLKSGTNNTGVAMRCVTVDISGRPSTKADTNHTDSDGCN